MRPTASAWAGALHVDSEPEAIKKHLSDPQARARLVRLREALDAVPEWSQQTLDDATRKVGEALGVPAGKLIHPTRVALTGRAVSPGLFEVMEAVGRERTLARLDRMISTLAAEQG